MNKAEFIKGIDETIAGLEKIKSAVLDDAKEVSITKAEKKSTEKVTAPVEEGKKAVGTVEGTLCREDLDAMKYNELKKLGASLGVKCTGTRDEITEKILAVKVDVDVDAEEAEELKESGATVTPIEEGKKKLGKKSEKKAEEEEDDTDEFDVQAKEVAEETDADDIIEALADVGVKATKKNYVAKLAEALRKGLIDLDDEEEEDDEEPTEAEDDTTDEDAEITADTYFNEYDPNGVNDPEEMTEERAEAVKAMMEELIQSVEDGELSEDDITSYIEDNTTEDEREMLPDDYTEEQLIGFYAELRKRMIDNDGDEHEPSDPYEIGDKNFCCGHELKYSKKNKKYICEICGEEYEVE